MKKDIKKDTTQGFRLGIVPGMADLYNRLWPVGMQEQLRKLVEQIVAYLKEKGIEAIASDVVSTRDQAGAAIQMLAQRQIDVLLVALAPYCPSGVLLSSLVTTKIPVLLWPMGTIGKLEPENFDIETIKLNHGVHGVQDLANILHKKRISFGVIHGYWQQQEFLCELRCWLQAGRVFHSIRHANPLQIGGSFEDMLDLQIGDAQFLKSLEITPRIVALDEFSDRLNCVEKHEIKKYMTRYHQVFDVADDVDDNLFLKASKGEAALRNLLAKHNSKACGLNFIKLCNDHRIADGLHIPASMLMMDGYGYAGEGDWVTAMLVYAMQQAFGVASFSEMFSVGYDDNRLVLRHWGEGNPSMARAKPRMLRSQFSDKYDAEFVIADFEFEPGEATLVNLNSTTDGQAQLISISGRITEDLLPKTDGPRAVFRPDTSQVSSLLSDYAYQGGSHHLVLVSGNCRSVLECFSKLSGWFYSCL